MSQGKGIILPPSPAVGRYCNKAFPLYRFVPGLNAHPKEDPLGHSFGKPEEDAVILSEENWRRNEHYLYGVDLYNFAYWWESHEAWEALWGETRTGEVANDFLQGLIQVSAAFLKWHLKERRGVESLFEGGQRRLNNVCRSKKIYMGLDVRQHLDKLEKHFFPLFMDKTKWPSAVNDYPFIVLREQ